MAIDAQGLRDLTNAILAAAPAPAPAQAPRARDIVVRDLSEATPEAWRAWRSQFEVAADLNNWNDARQRKVAFISMTGKAREAVAHIPHGVPVAPAGGGPAPACPAASLLLDEMEARFLPRPQERSPGGFTDRQPRWRTKPSANGIAGYLSLIHI